MKNSRKIIIEIADDIDDAAATLMIHKIVEAGKVSKAKHGEHYCWVSQFMNGCTVCTRTKRHPKAPDSFVIYREKT